MTGGGVADTEPAAPDGVPGAEDVDGTGDAVRTFFAAGLSVSGVFRF